MGKNTVVRKGVTKLASAGKPSGKMMGAGKANPTKPNIPPFSKR